MTEQTFMKIRKKIQKMYPEFKGVEPEIREVELEVSPSLHKKLKIGKMKKRKINTIIFRKEVNVEGETIKRILRVKVDEDGNIIKIVHAR